MRDDRNPAEAIKAKRRKAAHVSWSRTADRAARTRPGAEAALALVAASVDPEHRMSPEARELAIESALKAHFVGMAIKSHEARRVHAQAAANARWASKRASEAEGAAERARAERRKPGRPRLPRDAEGRIIRGTTTNGSAPPEPRKRGRPRLPRDEEGKIIRPVKEAVNDDSGDDCEIVSAAE
jgi:hypothetical protein